MQRRDTGIAGLLGQLREPEAPEAAEERTPAPAEPRHPSAAKVASRRGRAAAAPAERTGEKGVGRSKVGKRSNPDYRLRGLWLRTDTYLDVTDRLRRRREYADASELVQTLLESWLNKR